VIIEGNNRTVVIMVAAIVASVANCEGKHQNW